MSSGWIVERWSTERALCFSATGTERIVVNCSTWARRRTPFALASSPMRSRSSSPNAIDSTKMSSALACSSASGSISSHLVHPGRGRVAVGYGVGEQRGPGRYLGDDLAQLGRELEGAQLAGGRQPVAGLALERGRPGAQHLAGELLGLREHGFVRGLPQSPCGRPDAAAGARDLLVRHARDLLLVLRRRASPRTAGGCGSRRGRGAARTRSRRCGCSASVVGSSAAIRPCSIVMPPGSSAISPARSLRR